jgi:hypothetical protein
MRRDLSEVEVRQRRERSAALPVPAVPADNASNGETFLIVPQQHWDVVRWAAARGELNQYLPKLLGAAIPDDTDVLVGGRIRLGRFIGLSEVLSGWWKFRISIFQQKLSPDARVLAIDDLQRSLAEMLRALPQPATQDDFNEENLLQVAELRTNLAVMSQELIAIRQPVR